MIKHTFIGKVEQHLRQFYPSIDYADQAIGRFELALQVFTRTEFPERWAAAHVGIGTALSLRWRGDVQRNELESISCHEKALQVLSLESTPDLWAVANARMGYSCLQYQSNVANQIRAEKHLRLASNVWTKEEYPARHRSIYENLSMLLFSSKRWEAALEAINETISSGLFFAELVTSSEESILELSQVSFLYSLGSYCLLNMGQFDEALMYLYRGTQVLRTSNSTDEVRDILAYIPDDTIVVAPVISEHGTAVFVLPPGRSTIFASDILWVENLNDVTLEKLLIGSELSESDIEKGWLQIFGEWSEHRNERAAVRKISNRLSKITRKLWHILIHPIIVKLNEYPTTEIKCISILPHRGLGLLPLHAAWNEKESGDIEYFCDYFNISYTPSIQDLERKHKTELDIGKTMPLLTVSPTPPLKFGNDECKVIGRLFTNHLPLQGQQANRENVLTSLGSSSYIHFACHGKNDWDDVYQSFLSLSNGKLTLDEIISHGRLEKVRFVALSACETGITDFRRLPNTNLGFQSVLLSAGVGGVLSFLWPVADAASFLLMKRFYELHVEGVIPAIALSCAQRWLRTLRMSEVTELLEDDLFYLYGLVDEDYPFSDILYWAPFTLTGS